MATWTAAPARLYLAAGVLLTGIYFALPRGGIAQQVVYDGLGVSAAVAIEAGIRLHRPARALPWHLFALGQLTFSIGDMIFDWYGDTAPVPSVADGFYLAGYPLLAAGLILLIRRLRVREQQAAVVETAIVAVAFALVEWVFVMHPQLLAGGSTAENATSLSYPSMDIVLLAALAGFLVNAAWRTSAWAFLTLGVALLLFGDLVYDVSLASYSSGSWLDATWMLSYVMWGTAALLPSMRVVTEPPAGSTLRVSWARPAMLTAALLAAPAVLLIQDLRGHRLEVPAVVAAAGALALLVVGRLTAILRSLDAIRGRVRAAHSEAVMAQNLLAAQNERLREADRLKDEFVAMISHDLRTPLTSIMGFLELAVDPESGPLTEEQRSYLDVVGRNSERLLALVNDLLFAARLQAGELRLDREDLDVAAIVRQSVREARPRADAKDIVLELDEAPVPPADADRGRIFQLLDNLISNAIKFTPERGRVDVRVRPQNGAIRIEVADTGIGIPEDERARLFDRFFRASTAVHRQIPGTGLGLYIARAIVEAHGGSIDVESADGSGTTFCVELPVRTR
jgi:signal transduction histidine kinase